MTEPVNLYAERRARFAQVAESLERRSRLVSNLRGMSFGGFVILGLMALFGDRGAVTGPCALVSLVAFAAFVVWHAKIIEAEDLAWRWAEVNRRAHARVAGEWRSLAETGARFSSSNHPYAFDLDVFGRGSLFQRVNVAHTHFGQATLARLLSEPATIQEIFERQEAGRALQSELELRQRLEALALGVAGNVRRSAETARGGEERLPPNPEPFLKWAESEPELSKRAALVWTSRFLPIMTLGVGTAAWLSMLSAIYLLPLLAAQLVVLLTTADVRAHVFQSVSATQGAFLRYAPLFELLEGLKLDAVLVQRLRENILSSGQRPSRSMRQFQNALGWFELRHNGLIHPLANLVLLWDVHCVANLEKWQRAAGRNIRVWLSALGELEAISSFAGLAHDDSAFQYPTVDDRSVRFMAEGLGHPLIEATKRVENDVTIEEAGRALLITGSNMSGKSTLLRSMGLAAVMAQAGSPVCARRFETTRFAIRTSIRVSDSLERGVSHFYAEIAKIKSVLDATSGSMPVLFLLDEILHGTNSEERQVGARWVLAELLRRGALGAVSTHDLELCRLEGPLVERVSLHHFREQVESEVMSFDYKLREGPVTGGNALRLMRALGIAVPVP